LIRLLSLNLMLITSGWYPVGCHTLVESWESVGTAEQTAEPSRAAAASDSVEQRSTQAARIVHCTKVCTPQSCLFWGVCYLSYKSARKSYILQTASVFASHWFDCGVFWMRLVKDVITCLSMSSGHLLFSKYLCVWMNLKCYLEIMLGMLHSVINEISSDYAAAQVSISGCWWLEDNNVNVLSAAWPDDIFRLVSQW